MKLKSNKLKKSWLLDNWIKMIFSVESIIAIGQSDDVKNFVGFLSKKT